MTHELVILRPHPMLRCRCSCGSVWRLTVPALHHENADDTLAYAKRQHALHVKMYEPAVAKEANHG